MSKNIRVKILYKNVFSVVLFLSFVSCSSVPRQELSNYTENFNSAKSTTQDIILIVRLIAESEASESHESELLLEEKIKALDARIDALELISKYNDILVALASGTDPDAVYGSLTNLSNGLSSFGSSKINSLVENFMPYGELVSQAVTLIDNAIKAKKFKEAVDAAYKPVLGIIDILSEDADDLFEIQLQTLSRHLDQHRDNIINYRFAFQDLVNSFSENENVEELILEFNEALKLMNTSPDELPDPIEHSGGTDQASSTDLNTMKLSTTGLIFSVQSYNSLIEQTEAIEEVKVQYKNILHVTSESFENLHLAIQHEQYFLPIDITIDVLNLRKAYLKLQEAKRI